MIKKVLFLIIILIHLLPDISISKVLVVTNGQSISESLMEADPGDTIFVQAGDYFENLIINKSISLIGMNNPSISGQFNGHVILIRANQTRVEGFTISESGTRLMEDMACIRVEADSVTIHNNIITQPLHGIYVKGGNYTKITNNRVEGRLDLIPEDRGNGIHLWNSKFNLLANNTIKDVRDGIYFSFADHTEVTNNHIYNVRYGLHYMYSDNNIFTNNMFENNVAGAALMYSQKIEFYKNIFARCRGFRAYGILYQSMDHSQAHHNLIIDNSRGVFFDNCNMNYFYNNDIVDNDLALQLMGNGENNSIVQNNFINNLGSLVMDVKKTSTQWTNNSGGNFWTSYRGYDLDGNGWGDLPHTIQNVFQVLESEIPEIRFYLYSPSADLLEVAEQALPILELGLEKDDAPLMKAIENKDIPWEKATVLEAGSNPGLAVTFVLITFFILVFLYRFFRIV